MRNNQLVTQLLDYENSQTRRIAHILVKQGNIRPEEAWELGIQRLGARVYELRKQGLPIISHRMWPHTTSYILPGDTVAERLKACANWKE